MAVRPAPVGRNNSVRTRQVVLGARALWFLAMFPEFFRAFLGLVRDALCRHAKLMAENAVLRQQVIVLQRSAPRPRLKPRDRWTIAALTKIFPGLLEAVAIVRPETIIR